VKNTSVKERCK